MIALKVRGQVQSVLMWIGLNLVITFTVSGISWEGHIGGLIGGAAMGAAMAYAPRQYRAPVQWTATGLVLLVSLGLVLARTLTLT